MEKKPFEIKIKDDKQKLTVKFSGSLVINHIEDIITEIKDRVDFTKSLHINISNPDNIDLTFIQLVVSLQKSYLDNNLDFSVSAKIKDDLNLILTNAGFNNIILN
jgi:hypothetical protein